MSARRLERPLNALRGRGGAQRKIKPQIRPCSVKEASPSSSRKDGEPGNGGFDSSGEPHAGCFLGHWAKRKPGPAADRRGGRTERREELGAGELRREVSRLFQAVVDAGAPPMHRARRSSYI